MRLTVEESQKHEKVLFIVHEPHQFIEELKKNLETYGYDVFITTKNPLRVNEFNWVFIFGPSPRNTSFIEQHTHSSIALFLINNEDLWKILTDRFREKRKNIRILNVGEPIDAKTLESIFWFIFSHTHEIGINLSRGLKNHIKPEQKKRLMFKKKIRKRNVLVIILGIIFICETLFIIPLLASSWMLYRTYKTATQSGMGNITNQLEQGKLFFSLSKKIYAPARPILSMFYLSSIPDDIFSLEDTAYGLVDDLVLIDKNGRAVVSEFLNKNKTPDEISEFQNRYKTLLNQLNGLNQKFSFITSKLNYANPKIQEIKLNLIKSQATLSQISTLLLGFERILDNKDPHNYLIFFENNMEQRPGGGFIGSFATITIKDYSLSDLIVQDSYDVDGQLTKHIDPPFAIRTYLNQPHWFFRDSDFSPDFPQNVDTATSILNQEIHPPEFDGALAITTTAINNLLDVFGDVYLPDYNETINKDNFYIKTQTQVEQNFFAGSIQKKSFLSSLVQQLLLRLDTIPAKSLFASIKKSFDEKQMVAYVQDEQMQKIIDNFGWSGKLITPQCALQTGFCILDSFFPIDANVGINKANFFLDRSLDIKVIINKKGEVENTATTTYSNNSSLEAFPGGTYKNYLQIYIPKDSAVENILIDQTQTTDYAIRTDGAFSIISLYVEIPPKQLKAIQVVYKLNSTIQKGTNTYQLVVQKQIGAKNDDLHFEIHFPDNVSLLNNNFPALAKDQGLFYNTSLSTDKIFFVEFNRL